MICVKRHKGWQPEKKDAQCGSDVSDQIANNSPAERKNYGVARAFIQQEVVFDRRLSLAALGRFAWGDRVC